MRTIGLDSQDMIPFNSEVKQVTTIARCPSSDFGGPFDNSRPLQVSTREALWIGHAFGDANGQRAQHG